MCLVVRGASILGETYVHPMDTPKVPCLESTNPHVDGTFSMAFMSKDYTQTLPLLTIGFLSPSLAATGRARQSKTRSSDEATEHLLRAMVLA